MSTLVTIEKKCKLSDSCIWGVQGDYFDTKGVYAWVEEVPLYVTSNPFLANGYAEMLMRLIQDWVGKYPESRSKPFYIVELGTGSGKLSYYLLKNITKLKEKLKLQDVPIRYIMTDFTESNIQYWEKQENLQPFLQSGLLDFALFNMIKDSSLTLRNSGTVLSPGSVETPIALIGNYILDTIPHDAFKVQNTKLFASLATLTTRSDNMKNGRPLKLEDINVDYTPSKISSNYYKNPLINKVLESYTKRLNDANILIPIAGLNAIDNLRKISNDRVFFISTDRGHVALEELEGARDAGLAFHGSFSVMVNFDAVGQYFVELGGGYYNQVPRSDIKTVAFYNGFKLEELPNLALAVEEHVGRFTPADYFVLHRNVVDNIKHCSVKTLASHLAFTHWDPHVYEKVSRQISENVKEAPKESVAYLLKHLQNLTDNFYYMPKTYDVFFDLALLLHTLQHYTEAMEHYNKSQHYFGEQFGVLYNMGLCQQQMGDKEGALISFKRAIELNPDANDAKEWIKFIETQS